MNQEIKKQWVEALRSGKYEQGQGRLDYEGKQCCLGVLCKIAPENIVSRKTGFSGGILYDDEYLIL